MEGYDLKLQGTISKPSNNIFPLQHVERAARSDQRHT